MDELPAARVRRVEDGFATEWRASQRSMFGASLAGLIPLMVLNPTLVPFLVGCMALMVCVVDHSTRAAQLVRVGWNREGMTLEHGRKRHEWSWDAVSSLALTAENTLRVEANGEVLEVPAPKKSRALGSVLAHLEAHRRGLEAPVSDANPIRWEGSPSDARASLWMRGGRPSSGRPFRDRLALLLIGGILTLGSLGTGLAWLVLELATIGNVDTGPVMFLGYAALIAGVAWIGVGWLLSFLRRQRRGEVRMDPHKLTLQPVECQPITVLWEQIEAVEADEVSLTITTDGQRIPFDLSGGSASRARALGAEVLRRWRNVQHAADSPEEAEARRAGLHRLVDAAR